jgi:LmbE family N-acetylglucosaminyl deacetylase
MTNQSSRPSRRSFVAGSAATLPVLMATAAGQGAAQEQSAARPAPARPLNVVCVGAHPDDPESGCGGTLARYAAAGHRVTVIYLTRGEAGIAGKSHEEAAKIRTAEAEAACKLIGAKPVFAGQIDGATEVSRDRMQALHKLMAAEEPNVVFTHWPLDTHPDHQAASLLTVRAYLASGRRFPIYFFEVNSGSQTLGFQPTVYVDITATRERKKAALLSHRSQDGESIYRKHHEVMETFRGRELSVAAAEAFVALARDSRSGQLPGL